MSPKVRCACQSCTIRGFVGPAVVITVGVLLLFNQVAGGHFYFGSTWPVILIVIGLLHLGSALASREGHVSAPVDPVRAPAPPTPPAAGSPQTPYSAQGQ